jgi:lambda family phage portal protein
MGLRTWFRRHLSALQQGRRAYDAARWNRFSADFLAAGTSADAEIRGSLKTLRNRSRALVRDNPYARQAKRTTQINVIGARGIQMQPQVLRLSGDEKDERRNAELLAGWNRWCRPDSCDVTGRLSFHGIEMAVTGALPESGEIGIRLVRKPMGRSRVPLSLELIESDQIDDEYTTLSDRPNHYWRMGVELNEWGRPTRYAILRKHPGDAEFANQPNGTSKHLFIDAADFIHVYLPERVGQTRGVPWFASVITTSWNLAKYEEAHWTRKRVQANSLGWIQTPEPETFGSTNADGTPALEDNKRLWNTEPGSYNFLLPGETAIAPDFGPDDGQYEAVVRTLARRFAAGYGCSYATLSRDFSDTNYSSSRLSILEDRDHWRVLQSVLIQQVHQRIFEEWLMAAALTELPMPMFSDVWTRPERYNAPHWQARAWSWVDPAKEMKAMELSRALQLQTHAEQIMEYTGNDFLSTISGIAKENEIKDRLGLSGAAAPAVTPSTPSDAASQTAAPSTPPAREIEYLHLDENEPPIVLRLDLSRAAKR